MHGLPWAVRRNRSTFGPLTCTDGAQKDLPVELVGAIRYDFFAEREARLEGGGEREPERERERESQSQSQRERERERERERVSRTVS